MNFIPKRDTNIKIHLCFGDTIFIKNRAISSDEELIDTTKQYKTGCDSTINYKIKFSGGNFYDTFRMCEGDSIIYENKIIKSEFESKSKYLTLFGCDSIRYVKVYLNNKSIDTINYQSCIGDTLIFGGRKFTSNSSFLDTLLNSNNCDSIILRNLVFHQKKLNIIELQLCKNQPYNYKNKSYFAPYTISDTFKTINSCDSVVKIVLKSEIITSSFDIDSSNTPEFIFINQSKNSKKIEWYNNYNNNYHFEDTLKIKISNEINKSQTICLVAIDSFNCRDTLCKSINIYKDLFDFYNVFTPNNDGMNDQLIFESKNTKIMFDVYIYNRWGALVFISEGASLYKKGAFWNGSVMNLNEIQCPEGSYFAIYSIYDKDKKLIKNINTFILLNR